MRQYLRVGLTICLIFFSPMQLLADFRVQSVNPPPQSTTAGIAPEIKIQFDMPVDPATINSSTITIFGRWTGILPGEFRLEKENRQARFIPGKVFSAGEWITVSVSKRVKNAAGESLTNGYAWNFWTAAGPGAMALLLERELPVRFTGEQQVRVYGVYAGDLNRDGYHDLTVPNEDANDIRVFLNDRAGNFSFASRHPLPVPSRPSTNEGMDFNGDGFTDFAAGNIRGNSVSVLFGDGKGGFLPHVTYSVGREPRGLSVLDLDGDGDMDLVTANRVGNNLSILLNKGDGSFEASRSIEAGGENETACAAADANEDGILDLFVGAFESKEMILLLGDGKGGLQPATKIDCGGSPWMAAAGDVDGDGHVDVVAANAQEDRAAVIRGDGKGNLLPAELYPAGDFPLAIDLGDLDGDGDLDMVTSNYSSGGWMLYENNGNGKFVNPQTFPAVIAGSCAVLHDRDGDGDLDMTGVDEEADLIFLFENGKPTFVQEEANADLAQDFSLALSYPNPFSISASSSQPSAQSGMTVAFTIRRTAKVNMRVANLTGQTVAILIDGLVTPGVHYAKFAADRHAPGIYFVLMRVENQRWMRKMVIIR
jgi:hypothetical protein